MTDALNYIKETGKIEFIENIKADISIAQRCAESAELKFADPLKAVYHFRKHGADFPTKIISKIEFYLGEVPSKIVQDAHLFQIQKLQVKSSLS